MYCNQCGNIVPENAVFCSFCGAKCNLPSAAPVNTIVSAPQPATEVAAPVNEAPVNPTPEPLVQEPAPIPQPEPETFSTAAPTPYTEMNKNEVPEIVKVEKYYTFGHIMLCLSAVAIMAAAAGVFAGLYFSML